MRREYLEIKIQTTKERLQVTEMFGMMTDWTLSFPGETERETERDRERERERVSTKKMKLNFPICFEDLQGRALRG